jgi:hypothetical protein
MDTVWTVEYGEKQEENEKLLSVLIQLEAYIGIIRDLPRFAWQKMKEIEKCMQNSECVAVCFEWFSGCLVFLDL